MAMLMATMLTDCDGPAAFSMLLGLSTTLWREKAYIYMLLNHETSNMSHNQSAMELKRSRAQLFSARKCCGAQTSQFRPSFIVAVNHQLLTGGLEVRDQLLFFRLWEEGYGICTSSKVLETDWLRTNR
jgi:hypothetical protein